MKLILVFIFCLCFSVLGHSWDKEGGWGGGCTADGQPCDIEENNGSLFIKQDAVKREIAKKFGDKIAAIPLFQKLIDSEIDLKDWIIEPKPLNTEACAPRSIVKLRNLKIVACQDSLTVRLSSSYFKSLGNNQQIILLHEVLTSYGLRKSLPPEAVRFLVREIANPAIQAWQLRDDLKRVGVGDFFLRSEKNFVLDKIEEKRTELCSSPVLSNDDLERLAKEFQTSLFNSVSNCAITSKIFQIHQDLLFVLSGYPAQSRCSHLRALLNVAFDEKWTSKIEK